MEVITTHLNADFDALASMVAAKKLYPKAELVFSGSQEKVVRDFLAQEFRNIYTFKRLRHIDLDKVVRLIVVDTRQPNRIGTLLMCLDNPGVELHIYDHHPDTQGDMKGDLEVIRQAGSTSTIFVELFQEREVTLTHDEATLLALGIYEDTGMFLHANTTGDDLRAASWLLEHGANLDIVTQFVSQDLSASQVDLLGNLIKNATTYTIQSVEIVITKLTLQEYVDSFAVILHRLMVMENLDVLFGVICMGERIYLIARSRIPEVNVGIIARDFGGGGHASAASATVKDMTLFEAEEKLVHLLHRYVRPRAVASEIMSSPVITVTPDVSINRANELLTRYNITVLPVVTSEPENPEEEEPPSILGIISRRVVEKAIFHQLGKLPVSDYMTTEIATLPSTATLADIHELIIGHRQRLIPVVEQDSIIGVITRTDLLNLLVDDPSHLPRDFLNDDEHPSATRTRNVTTLMAEQLDRGIMKLLERIGSVAEELECQAYVVGGFVRDLFLHYRNLDIDIVIEGDGIQFAKELAKKLDASVRTHVKFGTATIVLPSGMHIDIATARLEYYEYPAAMPTVELSSIKLDLFRRDFTINAMAIHLNPERFGTLVDFFNSQNDLKRQRISVLHNLSFVEDPTRIFRAIRFEQRLDFQITKHSEKLIKNAVQSKMFDYYFCPRIFNELKQILSEDDPIPALRRISEFGLFQFLWPDLHHKLKVDRRFIHVLTQANKAVSWFKLLYLEEQFEQWIVYLLGIMSRAGVKEMINLCKRFEIPDRLERKIVRQKVEAERIASDMLLRPYMKPSEIYWLLHDLESEGVLYLMSIARKKHIQRAISQYVTRLEGEEPLITGKDLQKLGYKPGPMFRTMLNHVIEFQLNSVIETRAEALEFIRETYPIQSSDKQEDTV